MTSREHARRLMLILLSSDGRTDASDTGATREKQGGDDAGADRQDGTGPRDDAAGRPRMALAAGFGMT